MTLSIDAAREQWSPAGVYLNTASFGLPPERAWTALQVTTSNCDASTGSQPIACVASQTVSAP